MSRAPAGAFFDSALGAARRHAPLLLAYVPLFVMLNAWFHPGVISGEDFTNTGWNDDALLSHYFPWPDMWDPSLNIGVPVDFNLANVPLFWIAGLLTKLGFGWSAIERLLWLYPLFVLLPLSPYVLAMRMTGSPWASSAGALAFAMNTWTVGLIERGHIPSLIAYAIFPLVLNAGWTAIRRPSFRTGTAVGLALLAQALYDVRYAYLAGLALVLLYVLEAFARPKRTLTAAALRCIVVAGAVLVVGSLYWLVPTALSSLSLPAGYGSLNEFVSDNQKLDLLHSFAIFFPFYHHVVANDAFQVYPVEWPFVLVGLLVAAGLLVGIERPMGRAIALIWAVAVVFASGSLSFFGAFNQWAFLHFPGMSAFRDATKVFSLINVGAAAGIASLLCALPAIRPGSRFSGRAIVAAGAIAFCAFYVWAMRDAFNPLRLSNFAAASVEAGDVRLQRYLSTAPPGRVVFFPSTPTGAGFRFNAAHPAVAAGEFGIGVWPFGLGLLAPPGSSNFFGFYGSALAPAILCQVGIRYVALSTDLTSSFFVPWQYDVQRAEVRRFLDSRPWLRPIDLGLEGLPKNRRLELYRVTGCESDPNRLAFVARYPVLFQGGSAFLESLAGSPFWQRDPVVSVADENGLLPYDVIRNVVTAPLVFSGASSAPQSAVIFVGAQRVINQPFAYHGFGFSRSAQGNALSLPVPPGLIKQSFTSRAGRASVEAFVTPQRAIQQQIARTTSLAPAVAAVSPSRELLDPDAFAAYPGDGTAPSDRGMVQVASSGGELTISNPQLVPVTANVAVPGAVALWGLPGTYTLSINGRSSWGVALPVSLGVTVPVTLRDVKLMPGSNSLLVRPSATAEAGVSLSNLAVDPDLIVSNVRPAGAAQTSLPLDVTLHPGPDGVALRVAGSPASQKPSSARFRMLDGLLLPLSERPALRIRYLAPADPLNFDVALGMDGPDGKTEYVVNLPRGVHAFTIDPFDLVQKSLLAVRRDERKAHAGDYAWLQRDAFRPQTEAASYTLRYADLLLSKPAYAAFSGAAGAYRSATLLVSSSAVAVPRKRYLAQVDFRRSAAPAEVATQNVHLQGAFRSRAALLLNASLSRLSQDALPSAVRVGDAAKFVLTNGTAVQGVVASESRDMIVVKTGDTYEGVPRDAIATISDTSRNVRHLLSFVVPFDVPSGATNLEFAVAQDRGLTLKVTLLVRDGVTGSSSEVIPQDRALPGAPGDRIPGDWISNEPDLTQAPPLESDEPLDLSQRPALRMQRTFYDVPLPDVFESEIPQARDPRVVGIRYAFDASDVDTLGAHSVNVEVSGVAATSASLATVASAYPREQPGAVLQIDGKDIPLHPFAALQAAAQRGAMARGQTRLTAGTHLLAAGDHDPTVVQWGLVALGEPVANRPSDVADLSAPSSSYSERYGDLDTDGGILVMPTTFWTPWRIALAPASFAPSGIPALDYLRLLPWMQSQQTHIRVNGGLNAWVVPAFRGRVVFVYETAFYLALGVGLELAIVAIWILAARRWPEIAR